MSSKAIVPVDDAPLTESGWFGRQKTIPSRVRCFVEFPAPYRPHQAGHAPSCQLMFVRVEDLSERRLANSASNSLLGGSFKQLCGQTVAGLAIGLVVGGPGGAAAGMLFGMMSGMFVMLGAIAFDDPIERRIKTKILAGRSDEHTQITDGVEDLALAADGCDVFENHKVLVPIESLFRALAHEDADTRQFASDLIRQLPETVVGGCLREYRDHLVSDQLRLIQGMEELPDMFCQVHDSRVREWPEKISAVDFGQDW